MKASTAQVRRPRLNGLGLAALTVAVLALLFNLVPGWLLLGWILAPAGAALAIVALVSARGRSWKEAVAALIVTVASGFVEVEMYYAVVVPFLPTR